MKINFIPVKLYSANNMYSMNNKVSFGEVDEGYRAAQPDWCGSDLFESHGDDDDDMFQYAELACHDSKFRNLPKNREDKIREMTFVDYIAGYEEPEDDDFLDRLTY
jgi:hypothetical protein